MMFVFPPWMFAGFLGTAGLFRKPILEIEVFGTTIGNGSDFFWRSSNNTQTTCLFLQKKSLKEYAFLVLNFIEFAGKCNGVQVALNIGKRFTRNTRFNSCSDYCTESIT